eukprot:COSAG02_NODE_14031_length_1319_cov_5.955738_1_plen_64_part_10
MYALTQLKRNATYQTKLETLSPDGLLWAVFKEWDRYDEIKALSTSLAPIESLIVRDTTCGQKES